MATKNAIWLLISCPVIAGTVVLLSMRDVKRESVEPLARETITSGQSLPESESNATIGIGRESWVSTSESHAASHIVRESWVSTTEAAGRHERSEPPATGEQGEEVPREPDDGVDLEDIPEALEGLLSQSESDRVQEVIVRLVRQWAESDARAAAAWAESLPICPVRLPAVDGVAIMWAQADPQAAVQWVQKLPEGEERDSVLQSAAYEAARTDPLLALEIAVELPEAAARDDLIQHAALQWAAIAPEDAAGWSDQIPHEILKGRVLSGVATAWGDRDPVAAAQLALSSLPPGRDFENAIIGIVQRWAQKDPEAAADWVTTSFPTGSLLEETAAESVMRLWPDESLERVGQAP